MCKLRIAGLTLEYHTRFPEEMSLAFADYAVGEGEVSLRLDPEAWRGEIEYEGKAYIFSAPSGSSSISTPARCRCPETLWPFWRLSP